MGSKNSKLSWALDRSDAEAVKRLVRDKSYPQRTLDYFAVLMALKGTLAWLTVY